MANNELAIVIPAYKSIFFEKTLDSLANQTCKDFKVYIGDDNSPNELKTIVDSYSKSLNIVYHKFHNNIGAKNLVRQWARCVNLVKNERWIWLFSDDDLAENTCVEVFYKTIENDNSRFDVYRFNTIVINDLNEIVATPIPSPFIDTSENMAFEILLGNRGNSMPDHIFSREVYNLCGGFVFTDFAQSADWATSILFSKEKGICSMQNAKVYWRLGASNISGLAGKKRREMIQGYFQFLNWLLNHFQYLQNKDVGMYNKILEATKININWVIKNHYKSLSLHNYKNVYGYYLKKNGSYGRAFFSTNVLYFRMKFLPLLKIIIGK